MFKKLHIQMTFFCTLITGLILVAFSCVCLFIVEDGGHKNSYASFQSNVKTMLSHLEDQTTLSHQWMLQMESSYHISLYIRDNDRALLFDSLNSRPDLEEVRTQATQRAKEEYGIDTHNTYAETMLPKHAEFPLKGSDGKDYYASVALLPKSNSVLSVITLYSLASEQAAATRQRLLFLASDLAGILLLGIFSWFFTGRMIRPIKENQKQQTQFIAAASHELRSPLTVMLSSLSAMQIAPKEKAQHFSQTIQSEGDRMSRLIGDMLSLASADNGSWSIHSEPLELDTLLLQTYEKYEPLAKSKGLKLCIELPDREIPICICDGERIAQVLSILLDNAFSYTPKGGCIRLSLGREGSRLLLRVADNGPGIPDEAKADVFQRFYRTDKSHKDKQHFGLGLCIAYEIIKLHKGKIFLADTPGGGATFIVSLPGQ